MANTYWLNFGQGDPRVYTGLTPTFVLWYDLNGATLTPPGITEVFTGSGDYRFQYAPTMPIKWLADGGATLGASTTTRWVTGSLDPIQNTATVLGSTYSAFGSLSIDPQDIFGQVKRINEILEGYQTLNKSTGVLSIYSRGASVLLNTNTLTDTSTSTTRS